MNFYVFLLARARLAAVPTVCSGEVGTQHLCRWGSGQLLLARCFERPRLGVRKQLHASCLHKMAGCLAHPALLLFLTQCTHDDGSFMTE